MRIVGTAGHVDHGKSSLVISLTGHNPDRWAEERERGMTLDLGFAHLRFADGIEAGIIDVPGHERFLHNMLAGAAGMDLLLLVIDAVEGPRRQTREHLQILNFLNVRRAIIVLTKADLVDVEALAIASALSLEACEGTVAAGAPVIAVSNVTGAGIEQLKAAIHDALADLPPRRADAPAYLPVDRVFALPGHGTIVTGTLMQGTLRTGDVLELQPSAQPVRVRSLQVFGKKVDEANAGARVAVNIPGVDATLVARGEVLATPDGFEPSADLFIDFIAVPDALALLRKRTAIRAHIGSAEIPGKMIFEGVVPTTVASARARLRLSRPTIVYPGSRLVVRRMSPKDLLGGAVVLDNASVIGDRTDSASHRTGNVAVDRRSTADSPDESSDARILRIVEAASLTPLSLQKIAAAVNVVASVAESAVARLVENGRVVELQKPAEYLSRAALDEAQRVVVAALADRHAKAPWRLGCSTSELASALRVKEALAQRLLTALHDDGAIAVRARFWHLPDFKSAPTREQCVFFDAAMRQDPAAALVPSSYDAVAKAAGIARVAGLHESLESLIATGTIVRIGDDLYHRSQIENARGVLVDFLQKNGGATMAQLRDAFGTSRKYALPLLEHFDSIGLTIRDGDVRRLRAAAGNAAKTVKS